MKSPGPLRLVKAPAAHHSFAKFTLSELPGFFAEFTLSQLRGFFASLRMTSEGLRDGKRRAQDDNVCAQDDDVCARDNNRGEHPIRQSNPGGAAH